MSRLPISCFIIAKNEADRITATIRSVSAWVDEVVVVDSESSDDTVSIALSEGCRVITQPWLGFGGQKRFAEEQCKNYWVLNLDSDEVVTPALRDEIIALFKAGPPAAPAYEFPLELVYPGVERPRPWARDHWYVRLYDRRVARFRDSPAHDSVMTGNIAVGVLRSPAYHHSFRSYGDLKAKLTKRMPLYAEHSASSLRIALLTRMVIEFPVNFIKYYLIRRHFTGGVNGLRYAWILASYRYVKVAHMWRARNRTTSSNQRKVEDSQTVIDSSAIQHKTVASRYAQL
jgi:glycosyltransferase involved in cell wall biosynthesis